MEKYVLVTGGAGFIGSHVVDILVENGFNIISVDLKPAKYKNEKAIYFTCDINSSEFDLIFEKYSISKIIHLAAQVSVSYSIKNPIEDAHSNILATLKIIEKAKKYNVEQIIASSTAAVYASPEYLPVDENHPTFYLSPYAISKHAMEEYLKVSGINYVICRFSNVYGPRQDSIGEAGVVAIFADRMSKNLPIQIHGDGNQVRDFIYVGDVVKAILLIIKSKIKNEIFNVSSNTKSTINELYCNLKNILNYSLEAEYTSPRVGDIKESILDNTKIKKAIGFQCEIEFEDGLKSIIQQYK